MPQTRHEVSASSGSLLLLEFAEQNPLLLSGIGMGCKLLKYSRDRDPNQPTELSSDEEMEASSSSHRQASSSSSSSSSVSAPSLFSDPSCAEAQGEEYGEHQTLELKGPLPLELGDIKPGGKVTLLVNQLFNAPVVQHPINQRDQINTKFLLVKVGAGSKRHWVLRELPPVMLVGQLQPKVYLSISISFSLLSPFLLCCVVCGSSQVTLIVTLITLETTP